MKALVPLDRSENSQRIFSTVRSLLALQPAIEVHLLTVVDPKTVHGRTEHAVGEPPVAAYGKTTIITPLPRVVESHGEALEGDALEARSWLSGLALAEIPDAVHVAHVEWSAHPADAIAACAESIDAAVIVMAAHGRSGVAHLIAGSVTEAVIRSSTRPVLVQGPAAS